MHAVLGTWHDSATSTQFLILAKTYGTLHIYSTGDFLLQLQIVAHSEHEWDSHRGP